MADQQFVLKVLADIAGAKTSVEKLISLLSIIDKEQFIDIVIADGGYKVSKIITKLQERLQLTGNQAKQFRKEVKDLSVSFSHLSNVKDVEGNIADLWVATDRLITRFPGLKEALTSAIPMGPLLAPLQALVNLDDKILKLRHNINTFKNVSLIDPNNQDRLESTDKVLREIITTLSSFKGDAFRELTKDLNPDQAKVLKRVVSSLTASVGQLKGQVGNVTNEWVKQAEVVENLKERGVTLGGSEDPKILENRKRILDLLEKKEELEQRERIHANHMASITHDVKDDHIKRRIYHQQAQIKAMQESKKAQEDLSASEQSALGPVQSLSQQYYNLMAQIQATEEAKKRLQKESRKKLKGLTSEDDRGAEMASAAAQSAEFESKLAGLNAQLVALEAGTQRNAMSVQALIQEFTSASTITEDLKQKFEALTGTPLPETESQAKGIEVLTSMLDKAALSQAQLNQQQHAGRKSAKEIEQAYDTMNASVKDFNFYMTIAIEKIIRYRVAFRLLQKSLEAIKSTFTFAKDVEHQFAQISKATMETSTDIKELRDTAFTLSKGFGVAIKDVADIMFVWAQQGKSQVEIAELTKSAIIGMKGANLDAKTSVETLTSSMRIYNLTAEESVIVFDKLLNVQRQFAVTTKDLADSIKLLGTTAEEFGLSMDRLLGQITAIGQVTRRTGSQIANSLKTMFARFVQDDTIKALKEIGVGMYDVEGDIRSLDKVLDELAVAWTTLSSAERLYTARSIGGIRHYTNFLVLMDQYPVALKAAAVSQQSFGFATKATQIELDTVANALERTSAITTEFLTKIGEAPLGFKAVIKGLASIVEYMDEMAKNKTSIAGVVAALISLSSVLAINRGLLIAATLAQKKHAEMTMVSSLQQIQVISSTNKAIQDAIDLNQGKPISGLQAVVAAQYGPEAQHLIVQQAKGLKKVSEAKVILGRDSLMLAKAEGIEAAARRSATAAMHAGNQATKIDIVLTKTATWATLALAKAKTLLLAVVGGKAGLILLGVAALVALIGRLIQSRKETESFSAATQKSSEDLSSYAKSLESLSAQFIGSAAKFKVLSDTLGESTKGSVEYAASLAQIRQMLASLARQGENIPSGIGITDEDLSKADTLQLILDRLTNSFVKYANAASEARRIATNATLRELEAANRGIAAYEEYGESLSALDDAITSSSSSLSKLLTTSIGNTREETIRLTTQLNNANQALIALRHQPIDWGGDTRDIAAATKAISLFQQEIQKDTDLKTKGIDVYLSDFKTKFLQAARDLKAMDEIGAIELEFEINESQLRKELDSSFKILDKAMRDHMEKYGNLDSFDPTVILANLPEARKVIDGLGKSTGMYIEKLMVIEKIQERTLKSIDEAQVALGLNRGELEKFYKSIAREAAEAQVAFSNLGTSIQRDVIDRIDSEASGNFFQTAYENIVKVRNQYEDIINKAKQELRIAEVRQEIEKRIATDNAAANVAKLHDSLLAVKEAKKAAEMTGDAVADEQQLLRLRQTSEGSQKIENLRKAQTQALHYAQQIHLAGSDYEAVLEEILQNKVDEGKISEEEKARQMKLWSSVTQHRKDEIDQLTEKLRLTEEMFGVDIASKNLDAKAAKDKARELELQKQMFSDQVNSASTLLSVVGQLVQTLELGNEAISKELELQFYLYQQNAKISAKIVTTLSHEEKTHAHAVQLGHEYNKGLITQAELLERVANIRGLSTKEAEKLLTKLRNIFAEENGITEAAEKRLIVQIQIAKIMSSYTSSLDVATDMQEKAFGIQKDIAGLIGTSADVSDLEIKRLEREISLRKSAREELVKSIASIEGIAGKQGQFTKLLEESNQLIKEETLLSQQLWEVQMKQNLEALAPLLSQISQLAGSIAGAFSDSFKNMGTHVVGYFERIHEVSAELSVEEQYLNALYAQRSQIMDETSDEYGRVTDEIEKTKNAAKELNDDLKEAKDIGNFLRDAFGGLGKDLADIVLDINAQQLKSSLEMLLTGDGPGKFIVDAFQTGSMQAAKNMSDAYNKTAKEAGEKAAKDLLEANVKMREELSTILQNDFATPVQFLGEHMQQFAVSVAQFVGSGVAIPPTYYPSVPTTPTTSPGTASAPSASTDESPEGKAAATDEGAAKAADAVVGAVEAMARLLSIQLGTFIGVAVHGPGKAGAVGTGAAIGTLATSEGFLQKLFGSKEGSLGATLTSGVLGAFLPIVGPMIGGLLGGLIGRKPKEPERKAPPIEDNTKALTHNTEAVRALNTEFNDLRNELINAPSRFILAPSAGGGWQGSGGSTGSSGSTGNSADKAGGGGVTLNFNVSGSLDNAAADRVITEVSKMYNMQQRTSGGFNRKLRR